MDRRHAMIKTLTLTVTGGVFAAQLLMAGTVGVGLYMVAAILWVLVPVGGIESIVGVPIQLVISGVMVGLVAAMSFVVRLVVLDLPVALGWVGRWWWWMGLAGCAMLETAGWLAMGYGVLFTSQELPHPDVTLAATGVTIIVPEGRFMVSGWLAVIVALTMAPLRVLWPERSGKRRRDDA